MRIGRRRGVVRLQFDYAEADVLGEYLDELAMSLQEIDRGDPVHRRLFPDAVRDDPAAAAELRALMEDSLRETKLERIDRCRGELPAGGGEVQLDAEGTERWLTVVNDLRLTLGTQLDVREDDDVRIQPDAPDAERRVVYYWLTEFQDDLVSAARR